jgi:hypothetical protein
MIVTKSTTALKFATLSGEVVRRPVHDPQPHPRRKAAPGGRLVRERGGAKRLGSTYRSGRSNHWIKVKNPAAPAVRREAEEEWR